ncbi:odorant receptor 30a-like [Ooceraea biroi]|uniref:odorant receptor 30a-like n=1 Tax=Ooceraea biroi TaxID=2015173 RepID=UPI000971644A|nr:odorant receptor 30a-like [Ooceraea biroi]
MKKIMDMIKYDWNTLTNSMEYKIIHRYTYIGATYAQLFALIAYIVPLFITFGHFVPDFLDIVEPLNQSRSHQMIILAEYFVDNEKYFYFIALHVNVCFFIFQITLMSTTSTYISYIQHVCGMFQIASYRIEHALDSYEKGNLISERRCVTCARLISAIDIHRRAIMFFEFMADTFIILYFCLLFLGVASLTINVYCAVITEGIIENFISILSVLIHLFYFFLVNYAGQKVLDHSNIFLSKTYNSKWHMMPLHVQKLILFIMQRSTKDCMLLVGGIYVASLEGLATAMSASLSYFMVIYSTR